MPVSYTLLIGKTTCRAAFALSMLLFVSSCEPDPQIEEARESRKKSDSVLQDFKKIDSRLKDANSKVGKRPADKLKVIRQTDSGDSDPLKPGRQDSGSYAPALPNRNTK